MQINIEPSSGNVPLKHVENLLFGGEVYRFQINWKALQSGLQFKLRMRKNNLLNCLHSKVFNRFIKKTVKQLKRSNLFRETLLFVPPIRLSGDKVLI